MKICLAPIMGVTDAVYRNTFARYFKGVDYAVSPFISSVSARKLKSNYLKDLFPERNTQMPVIPQILSKDADDFLFLAEKIGELGHTEINWNLGCPAPMVAKKKRGSGLLPFPDQIDAILEKIFTFWPHKLSIKTRLGRYSSEEILKLIEVFNRYPLSEIIIHPRLGVQLYNGTVDMEAFRDCLSKNNHQIVYNGDITSVGYLSDLQKEFTEIHTWMIGRGLLVNPFLAELCTGENRQLNPGGCREILLQFHNELYRQYESLLSGPSHLLCRMKAFWTYWGRFFVDSHTVTKKIQKCTQIDQYKDCVVSFFETKHLVLLQEQAVQR
jgi:tRNA-dihydrouridine synthase